MAQIVLDRLVGHVHERRVEQTARSTATSGRASAATPGCAVATFLRDDPATAMDDAHRPAPASIAGCGPDEPRFDVVVHLLLGRQASTACASTAACPRTTPRRRRWSRCGRARTGTSARRSTCTASGSTATPTCAASSCTRSSSGHPLRKDYPKEKRQPLVRRDDQADETPIEELDSRQERRPNGSTHRAHSTGRARPSGVQDLDALDATDLPTEPMPLNMGPSHPAMHGTVRIVLNVEGEKIVTADVQLGYLHRCFEKEIGARDLDAGVPVHRPAQLRLADDQQRRLRDGGREAAGHRQADPRARAVHPRDRRRDVAHHRPPDLPGRRRDGAGRVHRRSSTCSRRASGSTSCSRRSRARG